MATYTEPPSVNGHTEDDLADRVFTSDTEPEQPDRPQPDSDERAWREWMMIGLGLTALLAVASTIIAVFALASKNPTQGSSAPAVAAATHRAGSGAAVAAVKPQALTIAVKADDEHGRLGPDGKWHDAFLPADFAVRAGSTVTVTVHNFDGGPHTFTSPAMGVNAIIPGGGSLGAPNTVKFTFKAPTKPGRYAWWCAVPCDPWAMAHDGYMRGYVTVKA
jgi:plastocyanin